MAKKTTIWTDSDTLAKLRAKAPGGNVSAYLREIANGGSPGLTIYDLAMEVQGLRTDIDQKFEALGKMVGEVGTKDVKT